MQFFLSAVLAFQHKLNCQKSISAALLLEGGGAHLGVALIDIFAPKCGTHSGVVLIRGQHSFE